MADPQDKISSSPLAPQWPSTQSSPPAEETVFSKAPQWPPPPPEETIPAEPQWPPPEEPTVAGGLPPEPAFPFERPLWQKILPFLLGLLVLVLLVGGIWKIINRPAKKVSAVTLNYWGLWEEERVMASLIAEYEKSHPQVKITYKKETVRQYRERLQSALARGEGPDIFRFHNTWLPMLKNDLASLPTGVMDETTFKKTFYPVAQKDLRWGNSFYGIPLEIDGLSLLYNEKLFKDAGLSPPKNWQEVWGAAQSLTVKDAQGRIQTAGVALGTTNNIEHWSDILGLMMLQNGVNLKNPQGSLAEDTLTYYTSFAQGKNKVWDETLPNSIAAFAQGKVAMIFAPSWELFEIKNQNPQLSFKVLSVPQLSGTNISWASFWVEGVSQKSQYQAEAWEFLNFLASKDSLIKLYTEASKVRLFGEPYSRQDLAASLKNDPFVGPYITQAENAQSFYLSSRTGDNGINDKIIKYFEDAVGSVNRQVSPKTALETAAKGISQTLSTYGVAP